MAGSGGKRTLLSFCAVQVDGWVAFDFIPALRWSRVNGVAVCNTWTCALLGVSYQAQLIWLRRRELFCHSATTPSTIPAPQRPL